LFARSRILGEGPRYYWGTGGLFSPTNLIPSETTAFGVLTPRTPAAALHAPQAGAPAPRDEPTNRLGSSYS
jgi:hypothetical protein